MYGHNNGSHGRQPWDHEHLRSNFLGEETSTVQRDAGFQSPHPSTCFRLAGGESLSGSMTATRLTNTWLTMTNHQLTTHLTTNPWRRKSQTDDLTQRCELRRPECLSPKGVPSMGTSALMGTDSGCSGKVARVCSKPMPGHCKES